MAKKKARKLLGRKAMKKTKGGEAASVNKSTINDLRIVKRWDS